MTQPIVLIKSGNVIKKLEDFQKTFDMESLLNELGAFGVSSVRTRTKNQSKEINDKPFAPYRPSTVKIRRKAGLQTSRVDLFFTGKMQGDLTYKVEGGNSVRIFYNSAEQNQKAIYHHFGTRKMAIREFMGLTKSEQKEASQMIKDKINVWINTI